VYGTEAENGADETPTGCETDEILGDAMGAITEKSGF
jgi:hypothetical protein